MDDERASPVRETYDRIAEHFATTREYPWPEVTAFLGGGAASDADGDAAADVPSALVGGAESALGGPPENADSEAERVGLDLGCGNGRHAESLSAVVGRVVGVDVSAGLLRTAQERSRKRDFAGSLELVQGDAASLPLRADTVDVAVYVATLHHLRSREQRIASLSELARVLAPGGRALVSAWSTAHDRFDRASGFDTTVAWTLPGGERVPRFYHIYDPAEFESDLAASDLTVVANTVSSGNCYAVVESGLD
ncbi:class I SAM-dependent methyltransferase [Halobellus rarus]|uniref:Class I SAM-dependent methyltransferase n=1 Tax=Halobellus rarus TaxID=1126237 RepID=A0ABD6CJL8_9EURY|nr:class I SAM-dependent methyltransferase [Halobellus rarus]